MIELLSLKTREYLAQIVARPGHAYLLAGPAGSGKRQTAWWLAAQLLGRKQTNMAEDGFDDPNLVHLAPLERGKKIKLEQIQTTTRSLRLTAFDATRPRLVLIESAESLTPESANALLKSLEEPGQATIFVLVAERLSQVLPTIRSRVQLVQLGRVETDIVQAGLEVLGVAKATASGLAEQSGGLPGLAWQLQSNSELATAVAADQALAREFAAGDLTRRFGIARELAGDGDKLRIGGFMGRLAQEFKASLNGQQLVVAMNNLVDAERQIGHNVNSRLVLEHLALQTAGGI